MNQAGLLDFLLAQPLLLLAIAGIMVAVLGGMVARGAPRIGGLVRGVGNLGVIAALLLTMAQVARMGTSSDVALDWAGLQQQRVEGRETRIPLGRDGHFWVTATINGTRQRMLIDTGATLTALSPQTAAEAGIEPRTIDRAVMLNTANGVAAARTAMIGELRFGNVIARDLDAVIAPALGETSVIGMNLLSRLASWRVEGRTLILTPKHPQPAAEAEPSR